MYGLSAGSKEVAVVNEMRWPLVEVQLYLPPPPFGLVREAHSIPLKEWLMQAQASSRQSQLSKLF